ncbi:MAG: tail fiber domain-containing protein [bacterium]|nr:tail fiber domain-containing protein [bacterium]
MINSLGTPLEWVETQTVFCDGERITLRTISYPSTTISTSSNFSQEFNYRSDGGRIGQLTQGDYTFGSTNRFNFIGDDFSSLNFPTSSLPKFTGFHNFDNNIYSFFGAFKGDQSTSDPINPAIYWENNLDEPSRLRFLYKSTLGGATLPNEYGTILDNGNWGIATSTPKSKLEILGGIYIADQVSTLTAPLGTIYGNGPMMLGSESFITSVPNNVYIATQPGTRTALGVADPYGFLHVHSPTSGSFAGLDDFKLTDQGTGNGQYDGFSLNINGSNVDLINYENGNIRFSTNGNPRLRIESNGNFVPHADNTYSLGSLSLRFQEVYGMNSTINTSDIRHKKNIEKLNYGLNEIKQLNPIFFNWKVNDNGKRIGFIAQEIEKIIPEIVVKDEDSNGITNYGLRYTELIPVLVNAINEQQLKIEDLQQKIEKLEFSNQPINNNEQKNLKGILFQNNPNPFDSQTEIKYFVNPDSKNASISIIEINSGNLWLEFKSLDRGTGKIILYKDKLPAGIYIYSLSIDGEMVSSKRLSIQ